jgi:DNA-binding response OmpR family regulator
VAPEDPPGDVPRPPQPLVEEHAPSPSSTSAVSAEAPTLLVVDDNADVRAFLQRELREQFQVETAADGTAALNRMRTAAPDVVVSDVMMPGMDGFALCEAIKSDDDLRAIPVVLLTARAEVEDALQGLGQGADDYVTKPFDVRELNRRIERLLEVRQLLQDEYAKVVHIDDVDLQVSEEEAAFVEAVLKTIYASLDDPDLTVDRLADAVALSRRQLSRRLREAIDESPAALIRRLRLEQAARCLTDDDRPRISDLAYAVGYRSVSHFSTAFKKHFGCPPSEYGDQ